MADKMKKAKFGSLQLDVEDVISWSELTNADFAPASSQEKENFIQDRESVSFWKDAGTTVPQKYRGHGGAGHSDPVALFAFLARSSCPMATTSSSRAPRTCTPGTTLWRTRRSWPRPR